MKKKTLIQVSIFIHLAADEAINELLLARFQQPGVIYTDADTGVTTASVYFADKAQWNPEQETGLIADLQRLRDCGVDVGPGRIVVRRIKHEDWAESWKRHFKPIQIGRALLLKPEWNTLKPKPGQALVILNPGLSFGTGQHPTTRFCLRQIVACHKPGHSCSLLDIGTGSGILAIAAVKLGYSPVKAFDFDPESVRVAQANAIQNNVLDQIQLSRLDLTKAPVNSCQRYDVVCANLMHDLLIAEKDRILNRLQPAGTLVLAGILITQFPQVQAVFESSGWILVKTRQEKEWQSGAFRKKV